MLAELRVHDLGVIEDASLVLGAGLTALTGETGAGKTLLVEALSLLRGGRADPLLVRAGADEALVEARFETTGGERILSRAVGAAGRSRAYVDGRMASVATLTEEGGALVDLHGQHAHQALLSSAAQRDALDRAGGVDRSRRDDVRRRLRQLAERQAALGGDERARARELDLLRFQLEEIDAARVTDPAEEAILVAEEERLAGAAAHREALEAARQAVAGEAGALDAVGAAVAALAGRRGLEDLHDRLRAAAAELADTADELRHRVEAAEEDPQRLAEIGARRQLLRELRRKYGETLEDVFRFRDQARARYAELEGHAATAARLEAERTALENERVRAEAELGAARRAAAAAFAAGVQSQLRRLALPAARFEVETS
ncbi:MAG TPA: AAA family ATPase, partial [Acidimicrobiales bacterium]|nr:AAA family ATPase [Acidimicrobiales bacterium]